MVRDELPADDPYVRPEGVSDDVIAALGKMHESLETIERARGALYEFHQLIGHGDEMLNEVAETLEREGHGELAQLVRRDLIGRNVIKDRWTFQIVDDFDDHYWSFFRHVEHNIRERLVGGKRHIFESEMKERNRTPGHPHHTPRP